MSEYKKIRDEYTILLEKLNYNLIKQVNYLKGENREEAGVIYVIRQVDTNNYKIGISKKYENRLKTFNVKLPFAIEEVAQYECANYVEKEKELHELFSDKRLNNSEFFTLTEEDLALIPQIIYPETSEPVISDEDTLLSDIKEHIKQNNLNTISTSYLQRKFKVGYSRASRLIDTLEENSIISFDNINKVKKVNLEML